MQLLASTLLHSDINQSVKMWLFQHNNHDATESRFVQARQVSIGKYFSTAHIVVMVTPYAFPRFTHRLSRYFTHINPLVMSLSMFTSFSSVAFSSLCRFLFNPSSPRDSRCSATRFFSPSDISFISCALGFPVI